jgi:hypothetical protein
MVQFCVFLHVLADFVSPGSEIQAAAKNVTEASERPGFWISKPFPAELPPLRTDLRPGQSLFLQIISSFLLA